MSFLLITLMFTCILVKTSLVSVSLSLISFSPYFTFTPRSLSRSIYLCLPFSAISLSLFLCLSISLFLSLCVCLSLSFSLCLSASIYISIWHLLYLKLNLHSHVDFIISLQRNFFNIQTQCVVKPSSEIDPTWPLSNSMNSLAKVIIISICIVCLLLCICNASLKIHSTIISTVLWPHRFMRVRIYCSPSLST